jgi:translation initiation factor 3 subunit L
LIRTPCFFSLFPFSSLISPDGSFVPSKGGGNQAANLLDNLILIQQSADDAWPVDQVYDYLHRLMELGISKAGKTPSDPSGQPVFVYLRLFATVALSRLECILTDYTGCLQALTPLVVEANHVVETSTGAEGTPVLVSVNDVLQSVMSAKISLTYHSAISYMMLHRYRDAIGTLNDICVQLQRGIKTGQLRKYPGNDQFSKQYERMISLLALLSHIAPVMSKSLIDGNVAAFIRERHGHVKFETTEQYEELFVCPKFISTDPFTSMYKHQVHTFLRRVETTVPTNQNLRSYLRLYTSIPLVKLSKFHDCASVEQFVPLLLAYKAQARQLERPSADVSKADSTEKKSTSPHSYIDGVWSSSSSTSDLHFYVDGDSIEFENYFVAQIKQNADLIRTVNRINTNV